MSKTIRKQYPNSTLNNLPLEDQRRILHWLTGHSYRVVLEKIAAPRPEGFGLKIQYTSLRRFWHRHASAEDDADRAHKKNLNILASNPEPGSNPYPALTLEALERYCFRMAMNPHYNADHLLKFSKVIIRMREQELKERTISASPLLAGTFPAQNKKCAPCKSGVTTPAPTALNFENTTVDSSNELELAQRNSPIAR
jgi:hypothetical protein